MQVTGTPAGHGTRRASRCKTGRFGTRQGHGRCRTCTVTSRLGTPTEAVPSAVTFDLIWIVTCPRHVTRQLSA
eukprot:573995-Rhodomonas_salina.1